MLDGEGSKDDVIKQYREVIRKNPQDDRAYNDLGNAYYSNGQYEKAIEQYQKAIKVKPEWVYYSNIGDSYRALREWEEAIKHYQKALEINPNDDWSHNALGIAFYSKPIPEYDKAVEHYTKAILIKPTAVYYVNLGDAYMATGNSGEAIDYYNEASALEPENPNYYSSIGDVYRIQGNWDEAIKYYEKALNINPDNDLVNNNLGFTYYSKAEAYQVSEYYQTAVEYYQRAISSGQKDNSAKLNLATYYLNLGDAYRKLENWDEAIKNYEKALEISPDDELANNSLGIACYSKGQKESNGEYYEKAIKHYQEAITAGQKNSPGKPNFIYYANLGDAYRALMNWEGAISSYQKALEINPNDDWSHNALGIAFYSKYQPDYNKAIEHYQEAITAGQKNSPGKPNFIYYANLGDAYRALMNWDKAIESYKAALDINNNDDITYNGLGIAYSGKGKYHKAIEQYQKAASLKTKPIYYANIGDTYRILRKWDDAIRNYEIAVEKAFEIGPEDRTFHKSLGLAYNDRGVEHYTKGDDDKAIEDYKKAVELNPEDPVIHYNLYLAYHAKGMYKEAEESLREAIGLDPENQLYSNELKKLTSKMPLMS